MRVLCIARSHDGGATDPGDGDSLSGDGAEYQSVLAVCRNQSKEGGSQLLSIGLRAVNSLGSPLIAVNTFL